MRSSAERKLETIKRVSRVLRRACLVLSGLGCVGLAAIVGASLFGRGEIREFDLSVPLATLTLGWRLVVGAVAALSVGVLLKGLFHLQRLFGSYSRGEIFTTGTARDLRQLGVTALLWTVAEVAWMVVASRALEKHGPFEFRADALVMGAIVIVLSWFMDMAAELREENELTI